MTILIKHAKTDNITDLTQPQLNTIIAGGAAPLPPGGTVLADIVLPSDWNAGLTTSMATGKLLGRSTAGTGSFEEITVGSNLTLSAGTLSASGGGGGTPGGSDTQVQYNNAGSFGGVSTATVNADGTLSILSEVIAVSGTTKTLALTDSNSIQDCSNASAQTITIPLNATVAFPVNTVILFEQNGAGAVTVVGTSGVTVNGTNAGSVTTAAQYSAIYLRKEATNTWYIESGVSAVQSVSNADGSLTVVTTSGAAVASLNMANANTWTALQIFTGWIRNSAGRSRNTADVTNATTTFANLPDLSLTLVAGRKYTGRMVVKCINSTATEGLKFDFNGGTATMTSFFAGAGILASGGTDIIGANISTALSGVINFTTFTGESVVIIEISLVCNAGGTFIPRFAENSTAVGTATVRLGTYLWLEDSPN